ncbi:hypothetical protein [Joostella sp. CR20]|uniref:hypothetical protein n=1 Tax=Joostella sp. CR20 TaxID=2804312 RepID=UPI00313C89A0
MTNKDKIEIAVRYTAYAVVVVFSIFRVIIPWIKNEPLYIDVNDGYVVGGCLALALTMEAVKAYIKKKSSV